MVERVPGVEAYQSLRRAVGWGTLPDETTAAGLRSSLFAVCVLAGDEIVGCGRVVGDGGLYYYLQDIIVLPEFQGQGLGHRIMAAILHYLDDRVAPGSFVGLMAAPNVSGFYQRYGFAERPEGRPGMYRLWDQEERPDRTVDGRS